MSYAHPKNKEGFSLSVRERDGSAYAVLYKNDNKIAAFSFDGKEWILATKEGWVHERVVTRSNIADNLYYECRFDANYIRELMTYLRKHPDGVGMALVLM